MIISIQKGGTHIAANRSKNRIVQVFARLPVPICVLHIFLSNSNNFKLTECTYNQETSSFTLLEMRKVSSIFSITDAMMFLESKKDESLSLPSFIIIHSINYLAISNSTRRFDLRPAAVLFEVIGWLSPYPAVVIAEASKPLPAK